MEPSEKSKKIVLVVEDHPLNMKLAVDLLELAGVKTCKAYDGKSALQVLEEIQPGLILLDINLPDIDGIELLKRIRETSRLNYVKVVAMSASVMKEQVQKIMACGFDSFVAKPIEPKNFIKEVKQLLELP